jgi:hypothetical protein
MLVENVNDYIKFKILKYKHFKFINDDLWELYKEDFADFIEVVFKTCNPINIRNLRTLLHYQGIWVLRDRNVTIPQALYNIL